MDSTAIRVALQQLLATLGTRNPTEDDLEKSFVGVYHALGYAVSGRDYRNKTRDASGIPDVLLHNSDRSIQVIVELKKPSENLEQHTAQLANYLKSLREARWGLLSNGKTWRAYQRDGQSIDLVWECSLEQLITDPVLLEAFTRQQIEVTDYQQIAERLSQANREGLAPQGLNDLATEEFLFTFSLKEGSPFAALVGATQDLLIGLEHGSDFVRGAYDFWKKVYAREIAADDIPKLWLASKLPISASKEGLFKFSYALETAYTLTARLILAKAIQDKDVNHTVIQTNLAERLLEHLKSKRNLRTNLLEPESYLEATEDLFDDYARTLFTSIYAKDIFDWWRDYSMAASAPRLAFARAVADLLVALLRFDFKTLEGDLLGEMYQRYFDPETRKALGEFYTPKAVVDFILDEVGYDGNGALLDPATGSGTFIVSALRRYLRLNANKDPVQTLRGITEEFKLVALDVNPFAVIMAQIGFASELLPLYSKAIQKDKNFVLRRLPIIRTDSLRQEIIEGEQLAKDGQLGFAFEEREIKAKLELPVKIGTEFLSVEVTFPRLETAKNDGVVSNVRQWLQALQSVFAAVEVLSQAVDKNKKLPKLETELKHQLAIQHSQTKELLAYLLPYAQKVWETLLDLKTNHGDGRFLKTLEDLMLGLVLKHYMRYSFVVGNPPYVRVQNIPEFQRRYWEKNYAWVEKNFDIFIPFIERALHGNNNRTAEESCWLETGGRMGFIVPNRFSNVEYASTFRAQLPSSATVLSITDFKAIKFKPVHATKAESIFAEASVYPAILIAENTIPSTEYHFRAARMYPVQATITPTDALKAIQNAKISPSANRAALMVGGQEYADVFLQSSQHLNANGWFLMPSHERTVFNKLQAIAESKDSNLPENTDQKRRLENYTTTSSGGFAGIQTSLDDLMVLKELERDDKNGLILVYSKGGTPADAVWLEQEVLRPFVFGKDVDKWNVGWDKWWVIFPYLEHLGNWLLMPTKQYWEFERLVGKKRKRVFDLSLYPDSCPMLDEHFPQLWKYLKQHEKAFRTRENNKYIKNSQQESHWYEIGYARSLNSATRKNKLLLQTNALRSEIAVDTIGVLFAGSGTHNAYGLALSSLLDAHYFAGLFSADLTNFLVKLTSSVFGGGYYSFGDQFIKNLPIPKANPKQHNQIVALVHSLTTKAALARALAQDISGFPESVDRKKRSAGSIPDLESLGQLLTTQSLNNEIVWDKKATLNQDLLGEWVLSIPRGKSASTEFRSLNKTLLEMVQVMLEQRKKISRTELLALRVPERQNAQRQYLELLQTWQTELGQTRQEIVTLEGELNDLVYSVFGLNSQDRKTIEAFLERF